MRIQIDSTLAQLIEKARHGTVDLVEGNVVIARLTMVCVGGKERPELTRARSLLGHGSSFVRTAMTLRQEFPGLSVQEAGDLVRAAQGY